MVFEDELEHICPRNDNDRKRKLLEFAKQYGFRLRFYHHGLFAIFGKRTSPMANNAYGVSPSVACPASSAK
jgi:hypothetical protein